MVSTRIVPSLVLASLVSLSAAAHAEAPAFTTAGFVRGDSDCDGQVGLTDALSLLNGLFQKDPLCCEEAGDLNADQRLDVTDVIYLLNFVSSDGSAPLAPYPECGSEPSPLACGEPRCDVPPRVTRFVLFGRFYKADGVVVIMGRSAGVGTRSRKNLLEELSTAAAELADVPFEVVYTRGDGRSVETFVGTGKPLDETVSFLSEELSTTGHGDALLEQFRVAFERAAALRGARPAVVYVGDGWDGAWRAEPNGRIPVEEDVRRVMASLPLEIAAANTEEVTVHTIATSLYTPCQVAILRNVARQSGGVFRGVGVAAGQGAVGMTRD